jgi:DnaK suppressor protein
MGKLKKVVKGKTKTTKKTSPAKVKAASATKKAKPKKTVEKKSAVAIIKKPKKTYSKETLTYFRKMIEKQKHEMLEEIESLNDRMIDSTTRENMDSNSVYSLHMADQGTDAMEREKTFLLAQRSDDQLRRLDEALKRIEDSTYGVCIVCGELIEKERLEAVPTTQKHVECKNRMKKLNKEPISF